MTTTALESIDVSKISETKELFEKTEHYYRATLELAQQNGIPIVDVISPYAGINEDEQKTFNRAAEIASEYGIPLQQNIDTSEVSTNTIMIDNILYSKVENGLNIVVYDTLTEKVADAIGLDENTGYGIVR